MKQTIKSLIDKSISGEWGDEPTNENAIKVIRTANFTNSGVLNLENIVSRSVDREKVENKKLLKGDLIIEKSGGSPTQPVGRVVYFNEDGLFLTNNFTNILRPRIDIVYPKYFFYALFNLHRKGKTLKYQNKTTGIINLKLQDYLLEEISLPSYENQIRIVNLLEKIETTIAERKNAIDLLDELVKATFYQMFGDPIISKKFERAKFGELSKVRQGLQIPISERKSSPGPNRFPYITNQFINGGKIAEFIENPSLKVVCTKEDVLMTRTGNTGIVITNVEGVFHNNFFLIDFDRQRLAKDFLVKYLKFDSVRKNILKVASVTTIPDLNHKDFYDIDIILPPITLQNQFAAIAQKIEIIKTEQEAQLKDLEELYASVSHKVFEGDINLSKVPFDVNLLPSLIEVSKKEPREKPDTVEQKDVSKEEVGKVKSRIEFGLQPVRHLESWEQYSFKEIADSIIKHFSRHYFNAEMILDFLDKELDIQVNYYSSAEQKKNPQYENADDFYRFIATAVTGENHFLKLEQVFYNAETENIPNISFTETDVENLTKKDKKERSGIYFHIKDETTTP